MKGSHNLHELQQRRKQAEEEAWVLPRPCAICQKVLKGPYGRSSFGDKEAWSCSGECEKEVQRKRKEYFHDPLQRTAASEAE